MKRGTPHSRKVIALARALRINEAWAAGILEYLWHFTSREAVAGNIGKHSDADIAEAVCWPPEKGSDFLIQMLVQTRWLDESPVHRLVVHDWHDHCDQAVEKYLKRNDIKFASLEVSTGFPQAVQTNSGFIYPSRQPAEACLEMDSQSVNFSGHSIKKSGQNGDLASLPEPEPEPEYIQAAISSDDTGEPPPLIKTPTTRGGKQPNATPSGWTPVGDLLPPGIPRAESPSKPKPQKPSAVNWQIREMLIDWMAPCRFSRPPDDALCEKLLAVAGSPERIADWLRAMGPTKDKRAIQSWGWFVTVAKAELQPAMEGSHAAD